MVTPTPLPLICAILHVVLVSILITVLTLPLVLTAWTHAMARCALTQLMNVTFAQIQLVSNASAIQTNANAVEHHLC